MVTKTTMVVKNTNTLKRGPIPNKENPSSALVGLLNRIPVDTARVIPCPERIFRVEGVQPLG